MTGSFRALVFRRSRGRSADSAINRGCGEAGEAAPTAISGDGLPVRIRDAAMESGQDE